VSPSNEAWRIDAINRRANATPHLHRQLTGLSLLPLWLLLFEIPQHVFDAHKMPSEPDPAMEDINSPPSMLSSTQSQPEVNQGKFSPGWSLYIALGTLSIICLAASVDVTSIGPALPVPRFPLLSTSHCSQFTDHRSQTPRLGRRGILGRNIVQTHGSGFSAELCMLCGSLWAKAYDHACDYLLHGWFHRFRCRE
jgi:hypothetical protein